MSRDLDRKAGLYGLPQVDATALLEHGTAVWHDFCLAPEHQTHEERCCAVLGLQDEGLLEAFFGSLKGAGTPEEWKHFGGAPHEKVRLGGAK